MCLVFYMHFHADSKGFIKKLKMIITTSNFEEYSEEHFDTRHAGTISTRREITITYFCFLKT